MEREVLDIIKTVGKGAANALFPNDIEFYAITIELTDSKGETVEYLTFPVNPDSFTYDDRSLVSIRKTLGGVTSLNTDSFVAKPIIMSGTFGRSFKLIASPATQQESEIGLSSTDGLSLKTNVLNARLKSGYGIIKYLESILVRSKQLDVYNNPYTLFLYLPLLGHSFIVEYNDFTLKQDFSSSNMMWKYNIRMTAIAPVSQDTNITNRLLNSVSLVGVNLIQRNSSNILNTIKKSIF